MLLDASFKRKRAKLWPLFVNRTLLDGVNSQRWLELTVSVPLAVLMCAASLGVDDPFFLLTHAVLAVGVVVVAYSQEREKLVVATERDARVAWLPLATAVGLFTSQWTILVARALEQGGRVNDLLNWAPMACFFVGVCATGYVMMRSSRYVTSTFSSLFKPLLLIVDAEIVTQIIQSVTRASLTAFLVWR
jgi:hypothetical protein